MALRNRITQERADTLYVNLMAWLIHQSRYRTHDCLQASAAKALGVSVFTLSAAIKQSTGHSYSDIVNRLRLRDACVMLADNKFADTSAEYIGLLVGYASRQAFYTAFARLHNVTPKQYRQLHSPTH